MAVFPFSGAPAEPDAAVFSDCSIARAEHSRNMPKSGFFAVLLALFPLRAYNNGEKTSKHRRALPSPENRGQAEPKPCAS